jgi:hypothetical protein
MLKPSLSFPKATFLGWLGFSGLYDEIKIRVIGSPFPVGKRVWKFVKPSTLILLPSSILYTIVMFNNLIHN